MTSYRLSAIGYRLCTSGQRSLALATDGPELLKGVILSASEESRRQPHMFERAGTLYIGLTNNLARRAYEHRQHLNPGFTTKYRIDRLIHAEPYGEILDAIAREKQLKCWTRTRKLELVAETNPELRDLGGEWFGPAGDG